MSPRLRKPLDRTLSSDPLRPLAEACAEEGRYEFMLTINPLRVIGGTGSPVNPIALFERRPVARDSLICGAWLEW